jgi:hypothetical protein
VYGGLGMWGRFGGLWLGNMDGGEDKRGPGSALLEKGGLLPV